MTSGTMSDKVSALTLAVQESPVHNIKAFESLLGLASKKSRGQAIGALNSIVDLLGQGLILPPNRRLSSFHMQPGLLKSLSTKTSMRWTPGDALPGGITASHLISWVFEDWLKDAYFKVIQLLEVWCNDEIEYSRSRAIEFVFCLLRDRPEQETNLLRLLVHKLGDRERKISSRSSHLLLQLQNTHPGMKKVISQTIEREILQRPGQTLRTRYSAVNALNQTILTSREPEMVEMLLGIYFEIFFSLIKEGHVGRVHSVAEADVRDGRTNSAKSTRSAKLESTADDSEVADKLVSAVLSGINRAAPFATSSDSMSVPNSPRTPA
jgi:ribosome biogenesis protein MAK21